VEGEGETAVIDLMGPREIQKRLGLSKAWFDTISASLSFPVPVAELKSGRIGLTADIEEWISEYWSHRVLSGAHGRGD